MKFLKNLNLFQKHKEKKQKEREYLAKLEQESQNRNTVNMLLLQKLVMIYELKNTTVQHFDYNGWNRATAARVGTQDGEHVYEIAHMKEKNGYYYAEIPNGKTGQNLFGFCDGDFQFRDDKHNYMQAVYDLVYSGSRGSGITDLMAKNIDQNLDVKTLSIPESSKYIDVFQHLNKFLPKTK